MNKVYNVLCIACAIILFNACGLVDSIDCQRGNGILATAEFDMGIFDGVHLDFNADVYLTQGPLETVYIEAQENILDLIELTVNAGTLKLDTRQCINNRERIRIYITIPDVRYLSLDGSGNIYSENRLNVDELIVDVEGSGDLDLSVDADEILTRVDGSGNINILGTTNVLDVVIDGSGDVRTFDLFTKRADIDINGSGDVNVYVQNRLRVFIDGSGDVFYKGDPVVTANINGNGDVIKVD